MVSDTLISIVIPTKNGADTLEKCLDSIAVQSHKQVEVLVIDSGSTDETLAVCARYKFVEVVSIPPQLFNHGTTRNIGVAKAKGEFILFTVQDAAATSNLMLELMVAHFLEDEEVAGVCGQQIVPHDPDKNPHEWFRSKSNPKPFVVQIKDQENLKTMEPAELRRLCGWDNVIAMYRKSILQQHPFRQVTFGEDMLWAREVLFNGYKLVYDFRCRVYHYHHGTYEYTYKRMLTVLYYTYKNFGFLRKVGPSTMDYLKIIYRNFRYKVSPYWIFFTWRQMRAVTRAYADVKHYLGLGEEALDSYHSKICGLPPQGKQNSKKL